MFFFLMMYWGIKRIFDQFYVSISHFSCLIRLETAENKRYTVLNNTAYDFFSVGNECRRDTHCFPCGCVVDADGELLLLWRCVCVWLTEARSRRCCLMSAVSQQITGWSMWQIPFYTYPQLLWACVLGDLCEGKDSKNVRYAAKIILRAYADQKDF